MPDFCTCGAQLPPDALFCHKCGKPQRDIVAPEPAPAPAYIPPDQPPTLRVEPQALQLGFRNPVAMKISLGVAVVATLLSFLPYLNWLAAGFFAVFFYRRRTGAHLNMESGVRMGWMTGVMMFAIMAVMLGSSLVFMQAAGGLGAVQAQFKSALDPRVLDALRILQSPHEVALLMVQFFVFMTLLSMAGGALGAKMTGR
ncbi:MAG TPA: zinc ribbon domain-containing protein [Bryobacteraceae bacterium]|nr:zinc ribbon domain-containing protein [Bryobacteraceae bacterium]